MSQLLQAQRRLGLSNQEVAAILNMGESDVILLHTDFSTTGYDDNVAALIAATAVLSQYIKPDRVEVVFRAKAANLKGSSLLDVALNQGAIAFLKATHDTFDLHKVFKT